MELIIICILALYSIVITMSYLQVTRVDAKTVNKAGWTGGGKEKKTPFPKPRIIRNGSDNIELIKEQMYE